VYTVSRLCLEANIVLDGGLPSLWLEGELSNVKRYPSGHWYFTIKDEQAQVSCTMWKSKALRARSAPKDGQRVLVYGKAGVYATRGSFQFNVDYLEDAGEGALQRRFEALKATLAAEGLFDQEIKRSPPTLPRRIGLITSPAGAAIRDILQILKRRFPSIPVLLYPVAVQGAGAATEIARALTLASERAEVDVLILARGGGSLEDLWSFNEEVVARAIRACRVPVISGIGHETDTTIADYAADLRAPTPSGAAELAVPDQAEWRRQLAHHARRLLAMTERSLRSHVDRLGYLTQRLEQAHPRHRLHERQQRVDELETRLTTSLLRHQERAQARLQWLQGRLEQAHPGRLVSRRREQVQALDHRLSRAIKVTVSTQQRRFTGLIRTLHVVSPLATLERGYAIVSLPSGDVIRDATEVADGSVIEARLNTGRLKAIVVGRES
jgi:exodeoxyribonuclease VII large subunit